MKVAGFIRAASVALTYVFATACSSDSNPGSEPPVQTADELSVRLSADTASLLLGTSKAFSASVVNQFGVPRTAMVQWTSTNPSVLTVTSQGMVTAIGQGSAQIVAAVSRSADTLNVDVFGLPGSLKVLPEAVSLPIGDDLQAVASIGQMAGQMGSAVNWTSSDTSVATVDTDGTISALGEGEVEITAKLGGSYAKAGVEVFIPEIGSVTISPAVSSIAKGEGVTLTATARSTSGRKIGGRLPIEWSSSDPSIASVNEKGRVTGKAQGFVTVRASIAGKSGTATVNVTYSAVTSVVATMPDSTLLEGQAVTAAAVVKDASGAKVSGLAVAWQSSNPAVATVDASGRVAAVKAGLTTISAISGGSIGSIPVTVSRGSATSLQILPASPSVLVGATAQLVGQVLDQNGLTMAAQEVTWTSSNPSVATVTAAGLLKGLGTGTTQITATAGSLSSTVQASVTAVPVAGVTLTPSSATLDVNDVVSLIARATDSNGNVLTGRVTTWSSSNTSVVTVSPAGVATAVSPGVATVTASVEGKTANASITVSAPSQGAVASIELSSNSTSLDVGQSTQAVATLRDAQGNVLSGQTVTWTTVDATIATVSSSGLIKAQSGGSVAIIASSGGVSGSLAVTVKTPEAAAVATVTVSLAPTAIQGGQTSDATVTLKDVNGNVLTGRTITYSSSNVTVASVGAGGTVSGISTGEAVITATSEGKIGKAVLRVSSGSPTIDRVIVSASPTTLGVGASTQASAVAVDASGNPVGGTFTWKSSNPAVVAVTSTGKLTAVAAGNSTISAEVTTTGTTGTLGITSSSTASVSVASVSVTLASSSIAAGQTTQATATARSSTGSAVAGQTFTYSSSNTAVATVGSTGAVSALGAGTAIISATTSGKVGSASLTVTAPVTPPPPSTPPTTAAAALAKIGPTVTLAEATALGSMYAKYDPLWVKWEQTRFTAEGTIWAGNYYDRVQIYYAQWIRTGNSVYKQRGDAMALDYRRNYLHASNYQTSPHWSQLDGVALHYWLNGDDSSRIAVGKAAWNLAPSLTWARTGNYTDARQQARALIGALLAWQMNAPNAPAGGWAAALDKGLDAILVQQAADGAWRYPANTCDLSLNYMGALLADALIRVYSEYRPDPRIPGAVKKTADFLWTQWRAGDAIPSFNYYEATCVNQHGGAGPTATPDLTGLFTSTYAWMAKQDPAYRTKSDQVFNATMNGMYPQGSKQFNQAFAFGWRAMGYLQ